MPCERKHVKAIRKAWAMYKHDHHNPVPWKWERILDNSIDAAIDACDESPWRSMESAPKDGSAFVVHVKGSDCGSEFDYSDAAKFDCLAKEFVDMDGVVFVTECMAGWMPLPAVPEVKP